MNIVLRIEQLRRDRGWNYAQLARAANLSHGTVKQIISGRNYPALTSIYALADGFGITLAEFFNMSSSNMYLSAEQLSILDLYHSLDSKQKKAILTIISMIQK